MLEDIIKPKNPNVYATYIRSRSPRFKIASNLSKAKTAISYHHYQRRWSQPKPDVMHPSTIDHYTHGLYRWENDHWKLIFVATPFLTKEEVSELMRCIDR